MSHPTLRLQLARWTGWFFLINTVMSFAIQMGYLHLMPNLHMVFGATVGRVIFAWSFLLASYVTQALIINFVLCLIVLLVVAIVPRYWFVAMVGVIFAAVIDVVQIIDVISYQVFHTHNMHIALDVFRAKAFAEVLPMSATEVGLGIFILVGLLLLCTGIGYLLWKGIKLKHRVRHGRRVFWSMVIIVVYSYGLMALIISMPPGYRLSAESSRLLLKTARFVPYYNDLFTAVVPGSEDEVRHVETKNGFIRLQTRQMNRPLAYPRIPMVCKPPKKPKNIVMIVLDTWRYDALTARITPNIYRFAQRSLKFTNNWSGGNSTQPGIFTLFYAIPPNYWTAMDQQKVGPVFIDQLEKAGYQMEILASATLRFPAFDRTVFSQVSDLQTHIHGDSSISRDQTVTQKFNQFLNQYDRKKPFFGFLFYDTAHNYCGGGSTSNQVPFQPAIGECKRFSLTKNTDPRPYLNRYHNAVHYIDNEVGQVLKELKRKRLLKNTIVIITADHGEEFDDENLNYWSHASAYTSYQLHVPMIISWPGKLPNNYRYFTTHYDVVPTLMKGVLRCSNPMASYSIGHSLFEPGNRPFLIAGSYGDYAVVSGDRIVRVYPGGDFVINKRNGHHMPYARLSPELMKQAYQQIIRFFQ
ncbi:MAG: sulfatase-like hydrolase/transferase [Coxiellaceae bacterium]|nr:sulfatase-like hydrolase/transferase [Coxiellaceae bacterium]